MIFVYASTKKKQILFNPALNRSFVTNRKVQNKVLVTRARKVRGMGIVILNFSPKSDRTFLIKH